MTTDRESRQIVSVAEVAALLAEARRLHTAGATEQERTAFLARKEELLDRLDGQTRHGDHIPGGRGRAGGEGSR